MRRKYRIECVGIVGIIHMAAAIALLVGFLRLNADAGESKKGDNEGIVIVSLGDSYSSGEGIEPFYGEELDVGSKVMNSDWIAHRSENSWPRRLKLPHVDGVMADYKDRNWFFVASSGAKTDNLKYAQPKKYNKGNIKGQFILDPQLYVFDDIEGKDVDYVTVTLGGNDVGFEDIIAACVKDTRYLNIGGLSDKLNNIWDVYEAGGGIKDRIRDAYDNIAERAGEKAEIIVVGYPELFDIHGNGLLISGEEARIVNKSVSDFNKCLEDIVLRCRGEGMNISFVSVEKQFEGHGAYSDDPYINKIIFLPREEDINELKLFSDYSMHPNEDGARIYTECVQEKINEIEGEKTDIINGEAKTKARRRAGEEEAKAGSMHYSGLVINPEDVVLKIIDGLLENDIDMVAECVDPALEGQVKIWGEIASAFSSGLLGRDISWKQLFYGDEEIEDVNVIECYSTNMTVETNNDIFNEWLPKIPGLRRAVCTDADVLINIGTRPMGIIMSLMKFVMLKDTGGLDGGWM